MRGPHKCNFGCCLIGCFVFLARWLVHCFTVRHSHGLKVEHRVEACQHGSTRSCGASLHCSRTSGATGLPYSSYAPFPTGSAGSDSPPNPHPGAATAYSRLPYAGKLMLVATESSSTSSYTLRFRVNLSPVGFRVYSLRLYARQELLRYASCCSHIAGNFMSNQP